MLTVPLVTAKDVESCPLYPSMVENPELRWSFIRKVYSIIIIQLLLTISISATVVFVPPVAHFFAFTYLGLIVFIAFLLTTLLVLIPLYFYHDKHPVNYILLGIFTTCLSVGLGSSCAFTEGEVILEALILTTVVVASLILYTFWAVRRGHDFSFLALFMFALVIILIVFSVIQIFYPMGTIYNVVYALVISIVYCALIIFDTYSLIKRYTYDQYILAALSLYIDIINLFGTLVKIFIFTSRRT